MAYHLVFSEESNTNNLSGGGMWLLWRRYVIDIGLLKLSCLAFGVKHSVEIKSLLQQSFCFHRKFIATLGTAVAANLWNDTTMDSPSRDPNHSAASRPLKSWKDSWRMHRRRCWWQFPKGDWTLDGTGYMKKTSWMSKFSNKKHQIGLFHLDIVLIWKDEQNKVSDCSRIDMMEKNTPNCPHSLSRYLCFSLRASRQAVAYAEFLASPDPNSALQQHAERWLLPAAHPRCAAAKWWASSAPQKWGTSGEFTRNETFPDGKWCATDLELKNSSKTSQKNGLHGDFTEQINPQPVATPQGRGRCAAPGQLAAAHRWPRGSGRRGAALGGALAANGRGGFPHRCQHTSKKHSPRLKKCQKNGNDLVNLVWILHTVIY